MDWKRPNKRAAEEEKQASNCKKKNKMFNEDMKYVIATLKVLKDNQV